MTILTFEGFIMRRWLSILIVALASALVRVAPITGERQERSPRLGGRSPGPIRVTHAGRPAFRCDAESCGGAVEVYGAAQDRLLQLRHRVAMTTSRRVADLDLISERFEPREPGRVVQLADLSGRARHYELRMADGSKHSAIGIALSHRCIFGGGRAKRGQCARLQRVALAFLGQTTCTLDDGVARRALGATSPQGRAPFPWNHHLIVYTIRWMDIEFDRRRTHRT